MMQATGTSGHLTRLGDVPHVWASKTLHGHLGHPGHPILYIYMGQSVLMINSRTASRDVLDVPMSHEVTP